MSFDSWKQTEPDNDICNDTDPWTCGCPECREYVDNYEPGDRDVEPVSGEAIAELERVMVAAVRLKR